MTATPVRPVVRARGAVPGGGWEMWRTPAHPLLAGLVDPYTGFHEDAPPVARAELPSGRIPLILNLGAPFEVVSPASAGTLGSFTAGLYDGPAAVTAGGTAMCLQVDLSPPAAHRVLGLPLIELTNRSVELADLPGTGVAELVERIADARTWEARFAIVDAWLLRRMAAGPDCGAVARAWDAMAAGGGVRMGALAGELGVPRTHLATRFRRDLGLSPRDAARVLRLERAVEMLRADPTAELAGLAVACGWYDQSHMHRDVRRLARCTPAELRARVMPDGGGVAADGQPSKTGPAAGADTGDTTTAR